MRVDLHIHTTASDGTYTPGEVIELALQEGLSAIAITDHDTLSGAKEGLIIGQEIGFEVIPGVELSTDFNGTDVHILGYLIRDFDRIEQVLNQIQQLRLTRAERMVRKLKQLGVKIEMDDVLEEAKGDSVGRPHIAAAMVKKGVVSSVREAFELYIGDDKPAYIPKPKLTPLQAVELIISSGGVPVLAHPGLTNRDDLIPKLVEGGLKGIEVYYPEHTEGQTRRYLSIAHRYDLIPTGGSDFHGEIKPWIKIGCVTVGYDVVEEMKGLVT